MSIERLHLMDMGLGKSGTAVMQDKYGGMIIQNWINNQEIFLLLSQAEQNSVVKTKKFQV